MTVQCNARWYYESPSRQQRNEGKKKNFPRCLYTLPSAVAVPLQNSLRRRCFQSFTHHGILIHCHHSLQTTVVPSLVAIPQRCGTVGILSILTRNSATSSESSLTISLCDNGSVIRAPIPLCTCSGSVIHHI